MKKIIIIVLIIYSLITISYYFLHPPGAKLIINKHIIPIEIAATSQEKSLGLGERDSLPAENGMLFPYDRKDRYQFWMKGMRFPLDFIWIDGTTIVDLIENVPPPTSAFENLPVFQPRVPVDKILEVNAGLIKKYGIKIGDSIRITN